MPDELADADADDRGDHDRKIQTKEAIFYQQFAGQILIKTLDFIRVPEDLSPSLVHAERAG